MTLRTAIVTIPTFKILLIKILVKIMEDMEITDTTTLTISGEKKQFIEEEKYDSKIFRHLRSIESRVKKYSDPKNKNIQEETGTQHHQIRKQRASKTTRPTKIPKTPKIYFSYVPKYRSTNIETVDPSAFFSLFQKKITPLDDPT